MVKKLEIFDIFLISQGFIDYHVEFLMLLSGKYWPFWKRYIGVTTIKNSDWTISQFYIDLL